MKLPSANLSFNRHGIYRTSITCKCHPELVSGSQCIKNWMLKRVQHDICKFDYTLERSRLQIVYYCSNQIKIHDRHSKENN